MAIFEKDGLDLTDVSLLTDDLGDTWLSFKKSITDINAYLFDRGYNLLKISNPHTTLGITLTEIIIDESRDTQDQTFAIRDLLMTNIIVVIREMGVSIDEDLLTIHDLPVLSDILDLFYIMDGFEDLLSLSEVLEATDMHPVDRFLRVLQIYYDYEDISRFEYLVTDINPQSIEIMRLALINYDLDEIQPQPYVVERLRANRDFLRGTLAWSHVINHGYVGGALSTLMLTFQSKLVELESSNQVLYLRNVLALSLLSDIFNENLLDEVSSAVKDVVTDPAVLFRVDEFIKELKLGTAQ